MLLLFPTLVSFADKSTRDLARALNVSSPYVSALADFTTVANPYKDHLLIERAFSILSASDRFTRFLVNPEHDYFLFLLRPIFERLLIVQPTDPRGPLLEAIRMIYFFDEPLPELSSSLLFNGKGVKFFLPDDPYVAAVLVTATRRFYAYDNFRRRSDPRKWRLVPPLYGTKDPHHRYVVFSSEFPDNRNIFHYHPQGNAYAYLVFCTLLVSFEILFSNPPTPYDLDCVYTVNRFSETLRYQKNYAVMSHYGQTDASIPALYRFNLLPPSFVVASQKLVATGKSLLHVCIFQNDSWCWCLSDL